MEHWKAIKTQEMFAGQVIPRVSGEARSAMAVGAG
jgi:hypothetical protein